MPSDADNQRRGDGLFVAVEGLSGSGKTTLCGELVRRLGFTMVEAVPPRLHWFRDAVQASCPMDTRLHFWLAAFYSAAARIDDHRSHGTDVVIDTYFYRTLAAHQAAGISHVPAIDWTAAARPDVIILLDTPTKVRHRRMAGRPEGVKSGWHAMVEENWRESERLLEILVADDDRVVRIDSGGLGEEEVFAAAEMAIEKVRAS